MEVIQKMLNNAKICKFEGCISTGKEANVYLAAGQMDLTSREMFEKVDEEGTLMPTNPTGIKGLAECLNYLKKRQMPTKEYAVKIFKTSILIFKDRERYVGGEFRFRNGHCKGNPRKMVKLWAEKEVRNLKRIAITDGVIKCPIPYIFKNNIIVMDFIGENSDAAPRLKDAIVEDWNVCYEEVIIIIRRLYQRCRLVHADLSEYNLLYHKKEVWVIDVSQSVEHDHPMALDFLRRDCEIINFFFQKKGVLVLTIQSTFNYVTDITTIDEANEVQVLNDLLLDDVRDDVEELTEE